MTASSSLILYRPSPSANTMTPHSSSTSNTLIPSRLFTQATGTAIATELLYRILLDIINRLLSSLQHLAARSMDDASTWMQRKLAERRDRLAAAAKASPTDDSGMKIVQEVSRLAEKQGFVSCPLTGHAMDVERVKARRGPQGGPPMWVRGVMRGIDEGRMEERDFWIQTHGD